MLLGVGSWRVPVACAVLIGPPALAAGCAGVLGIDEPNVMGDDAAGDESTADAPGADQGTDAATDAGAQEGAADSSPDSRLADTGPGADSPFEASEGSTDSATADTSVDSPPEASGPVPCATAGALLCDDFENGLDLTKWPQVDQKNATTVVDTSMAHRGAHALHMTASAVSGGPLDINAALEHFAVFPPTIYVRVFLALSSSGTSTWPSFIVAQQGHSPYLGLQLELANAAGDLGITDWAVTPNFNGVSTTSLSTGWQCVEWQIVQPANDAGTGQTDVWLDGGEVSSLHVSSLGIPDIGDLVVGMGFYQAATQPSYEMWIDDVFVDTVPVGCTK